MTREAGDRPTRSRVRAAAWLIAAGLIEGCAPAADRGASAVPDSVAVDSLAAAADSAPAPPDTAMPPIPLLPGEGEPRDFRLLLVNLSAQRALVFARAGAQTVVLDTVPATDSVRVDIRLRSDRVDLEAEGPPGRTLSAVTLELEVGVLNRWEIHEPDADALVLRPAPERLVAPQRRAYPRSR
jgi:hypothetical protein